MANQSNFDKAAEQTKRQLEARGWKMPTVIPLELHRMMKQQFEEAEREKEKMIVAGAIMEAVRQMPIFSKEETQKLGEHINQWLKDIVSSYAEVIEEMESEEDKDEDE